MIIVDKCNYEHSDYLQRCQELDENIPTHLIGNLIIAVCLKEPMDILTAVFYIRERGGSVLLLNGDTPLVTAIKHSEKAGCSRLLYGHLGNVIPLESEFRQSSPSIFQFSSGTTGEPKLIERTWQDINLEIDNYNQVIQVTDKEQPIILVPIYHSFGLISGVLASLARENKPIIITDKNPKYWMQVIQSTPNSIVFSVPFLLQLMLSFSKQAFRFHKIISSGSPLSKTLLKNLEKNSIQLSQQYGCSELGCISFGWNPVSSVDVGVPLKQFTLASGFSKELPEEICVDFNGKAFRTGDMGYVSEAGSIHLLGRIDDQINVSGLKVLPSEVESIIEKMKDVFEVVVHRMKHPVWGEAVKALVVGSSSLKEQDVKSWCMQHLPPHKVPRTVEFVREIPRMHSGKVNRKILVEREMM